MKFLICHILLLLLTVTSYAQEAYLYPLNFLRLKNNYIFENPAASTLIERAECNLIHSAFSGPLSSVGINYIDATFRLGKSDVPAHAAGISLLSEYETEILKRNRFYLRYSYTTSLSSSLKLAAGIQAGLFNYLVKATQNSAGNSSAVPDASIGLWLSGSSFNAGISTVQLLSSEVKPVNRTYVLGRYVNIFLDYKKSLSPNTEILLATKIYKGRIDYEGLWLSGTLQFMNNLSAGVNYLWKKGPVFTVGIVKFNVLRIQSDLYFSYFQPTGKNLLANTSRYEVSVHIFPFKKSTSEEIPEEGAME